MHGASTLDGYTFTLDTVLSDSVPENFIRYNYEGNLNGIFRSIQSVNAALPVLFAEKGPFYAEYELNSCLGMPVQFAQIKVDGSQVEAYTPGANSLAKGVFESICTCRKDVEGVRFASDSPNEEDLRFNESHSGYLLYVKTKEAKQPMSRWRLSHLDHAAAVYVEVMSDVGDGMNYGFHLGGHFRELGIPVLFSNCPADVKADGKYIVQADEFHLKGAPGGILER
jgi:hypothetical protein